MRDIIKETGFCIVLRQESALDSINTEIGYRTVWDYANYDDEETISNNNGEYQKDSESGNVGAINMKDNPDILCGQ